MQIGPEGFPHAHNFLFLGEQLVQGEQDLHPAAEGARRAAGARRTPRFEKWLWHSEINRFSFLYEGSHIGLLLSSIICVGGVQKGMQRVHQRVKIAATPCIDCRDRRRYSTVKTGPPPRSARTAAPLRGPQAQRAGGERRTPIRGTVTGAAPRIP